MRLILHSITLYLSICLYSQRVSFSVYINAVAQVIVFVGVASCRQCRARRRHHRHCHSSRELLIVDPFQQQIYALRCVRQK